MSDDLPLGVQGVVIVALVGYVLGCGSDTPKRAIPIEHSQWDRRESSTLQVTIWYSRSDAFAVRPLVRVDLRQQEGGGFRRVVHGDSIDPRLNYSSPVDVPIHGKLDVRVLLVGPATRVDTLARSDWITIQLQPAYGYWVAVSVGDSSGTVEALCGPHYKSYPIVRNSLLRGDSLLVDVRGMSKTALC